MIGGKAHDGKEGRPPILGAIDFTAGCLGAVVNAMVGLPLDTIKVKMQTFPSLYGGAYGCFKSTLRKYGVKGLYAGAVPAVIAEVSEKSVLFLAHGYCEYIITMVSGNKEHPTALESAFAGMFASIFSSFTLCPTEMIKCKLQALRDLGHPAANLTPYRITKSVIKSYGFRGLYTGLTLTVMREMPGYFFWFGSYRMTKDYLTNGDPANDALWKTAVAGGNGGLSLWIVIYPIDLVKTRAQIAEMQEAMSFVFYRILREEGFLGLYRGVMPSLVRTYPCCGALFVVYENSHYYMTKLAARLGYLDK